MKLLSSFSSPASSISSAASFDSRSATASCLAGILRRIICSRTLPTHPSDNMTEECASAKSFRSESNAGLIARLMGLDSMPETNFRSSSISRSRSMSSADRSRDDAAKAGLHRRVRSTATVRESGEFLVLSFESASESRELWSRERRPETGFGESKQRKRADAKTRSTVAKRKVLRDSNGGENTRRNAADHNRKKVRESTVSSVPAKIPSGKQNLVEPEAVKPKTSDVKPDPRIKKKKNNFHVANSDDLSPVSVLDSDQFLVSLEAPKSGNNSTSRRKLSLETNLIGGEEAKQRKYVENPDVLDEIWRLSEAEFSGASWYRNLTRDHRGYHGIGEELEALILNELVEELAD